ncbi:fumarate reductase, partial [Lactiplantibacillus plantarum]
MKYIALIGTAAQQSYNRELLQFMKHHFSQRATIDVNEITGIPLFNEPTQNHIPATVQALNDKISQADGVIIGVPEYDHAIPAALKNVIEWLSYQLHPFANKPVMLVGTSLGVQGTCRAQGDLRNILNAPGVDAQVLPGNEYMLSYAAKAFDQNGQMTDAPSIKFLERCFDNFEKYVKALNGTPALNVNWHGNYDVIVLGFGGAGASAARFAADNGAHVLVVDAAPFGREGGNTRYSAF